MKEQCGCGLLGLGNRGRFCSEKHNLHEHTGDVAWMQDVEMIYCWPSPVKNTIRNNDILTNTGKFDNMYL